MDPIPLHHVWQYTDVDRAFWDEHLEDWLPRRIFDAHTHVNEPRFRVEEMTEAKRRQYWVNEVAEPIGAERCRSVATGSSSPAASSPASPSDFPFSTSTSRRSNAQPPGRMRAAGLVSPGRGPAAMVGRARRPRAGSAATVLGVKVYYALISQDPATRDKHLEASIFDFLPHHQLEVLDRRRAWVTLHVPKADRLGHPQNIAEIREIRRQYPNVVLVIAHLGRCYTLPHAEEAFPPLADDEGLYFDISAVLNPDVLRLALQTLRPAPHPLRHRQPDPLHAGPPAVAGANVRQPHQLPVLLQPRARAAGDRGPVHALHVRGAAGPQTSL